MVLVTLTPADFRFLLINVVRAWRVVRELSPLHCTYGSIFLQEYNANQFVYRKIQFLFPFLLKSSQFSNVEIIKDNILEQKYSKTPTYFYIM